MWLNNWLHIVAIVFIVLSFFILGYKNIYYNNHKDKYNAKIDITFKVSALIVMLIACILAVL